MSDLLTLIYGIILIACLSIWLLPEPYYKYKIERLKETEKTTRESIILAQKIAERDKEAEKTKQLQIKADRRVRE
jgi:hypothetical protein